MPDQIIVFQARTTAEVQIAEAWVSFDAMGINKVIVLTDNGSQTGDIAFDGVWEGHADGLFAADIQTTLFAKTADGTLHSLDQGVVFVGNSQRTLVAWRLAQEGGGVRAWRTATDWPANKALIGGDNYVFIGFAWMLLVLVYVGLLFETAPPRAGKAPQ